jgi:uncharacterized protein YceH (UPF0502 family)
MEITQPLPELSLEEIRILGALIEKSRATPEYYPLTINSLQTACNQKSARKPVVNFDENTIINTLDALKRKGLVATVTGGGSRTIKYKHNLAVHYPFTPDQLTVLCLLFLRGPLTPGEINSNSNRLYEFDHLEEVMQTIESLTNGEYPVIATLPRQAGQKELRYRHFFANDTYFESYMNDSNSEVNESIQSNLNERIERLETQLNTLQKAFDDLYNELKG